MKKAGANKKAMLTTPQDIRCRLGVFIREARIASGLSRKRVCEALDVSNSQLSAWEYGKAEPRFCYLIRLCSLFGIEFDRILEIYGTNIHSADAGNPMAKYSALSEESQKHVNSIIDALLISDVINQKDKTITSIAEQTNNEEPIITDEFTEKTETMSINTLAPIKRGRGRPRKAEADETISVPVAKSGRGRPRKVPS